MVGPRIQGAGRGTGAEWTVIAWKKVRAETGNENVCGGPTLEGGWGEAPGRRDTHIPVASNPLT